MALQCGIVGLPNVGKSTLFNAMTGAEAYAADKLFATLDPTVRRIAVPGGNVVLADTVGFVRDLPHDLVAAFRSTLSEAREADFLLHVVDAADPHREERIAQVDEVLTAVGAGDRRGDAGPSRAGQLTELFQHIILQHAEMRLDQQGVVALLRAVKHSPLRYYSSASSPA
ncbi:hypothetical protein G6F23_013182 [Rhizopus arrhizus]|nr:hypothetical protein G6F23_013182 [Rhizopus arrhizus]